MPATPLQAGGHDGVSQNEAGDVFYKPTDAEEVAFYMKISNDADYEDWLDIVPQLYGVLTQGDLTEQKQGKDEQLANEPATDSQAPESDNQAPKKKKKEQLLVLQNMLYGYAQPSILDIKLGHILWDERADAVKRERLDKVAQTTTSGSLDARITGMNVYYDCKPNSVPQENDDKTLDITERTVSEDGGERVVFGKLYGRTLDKSTFKEGLLRYFVPFGTAGHNQHSAKLSPTKQEFYKHLTFYLAHRLEQITDILRPKSFEMRGASLLFLYEASDKVIDQKLELLEEMQALEAAEAEYQEDVYLQKTEQIKQKLDKLNNIKAGSGNPKKGQFEDEEEDEKEFSSSVIQDQLFKLNLIDFAHTKLFDDNRGPDPGIINGMENLTKVFKSFSSQVDNW